MSLDRIRRVTDLFVEGQELYLGMDDAAAPILVWIKKLNSFEVEEARRDGIAARSMRLLELAKDENPERVSLRLQVDRWTDDELRQYRTGQQADEMYLDALNDLESDEDWVEKMQMIRRMPTLLNDEGAPPDDPRRKQLDDLNIEYLGELQKRTGKAQEEAVADLKKVKRKDLVDQYFEAWSNRVSLDEFMAERRTTEIFAAMRDCKAVKAGERWDHADCTHERLLNERSQVRELPEQVIEKVVAVLDGVTVPQRESGNSDAPANSSASSGPLSAAEAPSTPSTPDATPVAAPTT